MSKSRVLAAKIVSGGVADLQGAGAAAEHHALLVLPLLQSGQPGAQLCRQLCVSNVPVPGAPQPEGPLRFLVVKTCDCSSKRWNGSGRCSCKIWPVDTSSLRRGVASMTHHWNA